MKLRNVVIARPKLLFFSQPIHCTSKMNITHFVGNFMLNKFCLLVFLIKMIVSEDDGENVQISLREILTPSWNQTIEQN